MRIVGTGSTFRIYGDDLLTFDKLPTDVYTIEFSKMSGFFLERHAPIEIKEKLYGTHNNKAFKVLDRFKEFERNLGVLLSGKKGIGKSIFAKKLAIEAINRDMPVVLVEKYLPGVEGFIQSIDQEIIVIFDEYDKTYGSVNSKDGESDAQAALLTLFDGMAMGKKLFVITCNETRYISDYLINRPGRFHFHIRFNEPETDEIRAYLMDKLKPEYYEEINDIITFSKKIPLNYDKLRAIAVEVNAGLKFKDAIGDLNIVNMTTEEYVITVVLNNGERFVTVDDIDMFDLEEEIEVEFADSKNSNSYVRIEFNCMDVRPDYNGNKIFIDPRNAKLDYWSYRDKDKYEDRKNEVLNSGIKEIAIARKLDRGIHYKV